MKVYLGWIVLVLLFANIDSQSISLAVPPVRIFPPFPVWGTKFCAVDDKENTDVSYETNPTNPDFAQLCVTLGGQVLITLHKDTQLSNTELFLSGINPFFYGVHLQGNMYEIRQDTEHDGHQELSLVAPYPSFSKSGLSYAFRLPDIVPVALLDEFWMYSQGSLDRIPNSGTIKLAGVRKACTDSSSKTIKRLCVAGDATGVYIYWQYSSAQTPWLVNIYLYGEHLPENDGNRPNFNFNISPSSQEYTLSQDKDFDGLFETDLPLPGKYIQVTPDSYLIKLKTPFNSFTLPSKFRFWAYDWNGGQPNGVTEQTWVPSP